MFDARNIGCFEIYDVSTRTRERRLSKCGHFMDGGKGGSIFRDFLQASFVDGT